jgi:hypothetical protein
MAVMVWIDSCESWDNSDGWNINNAWDILVAQP